MLNQLKVPVKSTDSCFNKCERDIYQENVSRNELNVFTEKTQDSVSKLNDVVKENMRRNIYKFYASNRVRVI